MTLAASDFVSTALPTADSNVHKSLRNGDGSIKLGDFLKVSDSSSNKELLGALGYKVEGLPESEYTSNLTIEGVTPPSEDPEPAQTDKIDVWDFGAEQLDTEKYNNKLSESIINGWYGSSIAPGTKGQSLTGSVLFEVKGNNDAVELRCTSSNASKNHRLRTTNTNLTRYDEKSLTCNDVTYGIHL